jgi:hypothetical protein
MFTYYDKIDQKPRLKLRYKYAAMALGLGFMTGALVAKLF